MNANDLKSTLQHLNADDALSFVGLQARPSTGGKLVQRAAILGAGIAVGAGLAFLLGPRDRRPATAGTRAKAVKAPNTEALPSAKKRSAAQGRTAHPRATAHR